MFNTKIFSTYAITGSTVYMAVRKPDQNYILDFYTGSFVIDADASIETLILPEDGISKGSFWVNLNTVGFEDNYYIATFYKQVGGSANPAVDTYLGSNVFRTINDLIQA